MEHSKEYLKGRKAGVTQMLDFIDINVCDIMQDNRPLFDVLLDVTHFLKTIKDMKDNRIDQDGKGITIYFDNEVTEDKVLTLLDRLYVARNPDDTHYNVATMIAVLTEDV